jgi:hypothetical protein
MYRSIELLTWGGVAAFQRLLSFKSLPDKGRNRPKTGIGELRRQSSRHWLND